MDPQLFDILWEVEPRGGHQGGDPHRLVLPLAAHQLDAAPALARRRAVQPAHARQGDRLPHSGRLGRGSARRRHAAAARRRRLLSGLVRACRRRLGAALAAHDPRPARPRVPERPHRACPVERPAARPAMRSRSPTSRSAARPPVRHVARGRAQCRRDRRRRERVASAAKPKKGNVLAKLFGFSTDEEEDEDATPAAGEPRRGGRHQAGGGSANSAAAGPPGRDRARTQRAKPRRRLRARVRDLDAVLAARRAPCRARRPRSAEPTDLSASRRDDREHHVLAQ